MNTVYSGRARDYPPPMATGPDLASNPYLRGVWEPVHDELDVADLVIHGHLPDELVGSYLRNGPNPAFPPTGRYHLFDGDGMVHGVELRDGTARYRNRFIDSRALQAERKAGRPLYGGLSEFRLPDPEVVAEAGMMKNTANTHLVRHAGRLLALMEAAPPTELSEALATIGEYDFDGALAGSMTAHPKLDPTTGELVFFGYSPLPPYLRLHVVAPDGRLVRSQDIDLPAPVMMHDFVITPLHVVFFDLPAVFDLPAMLAGGEGIAWRPEHGARIGVLDRTAPDADVRWIEVDPFWVFHFLNAHEGPGDVIVVDGCRAPRLNIAFGDATLDEPADPHLHRWHIDAVKGTVTDEPLDDRPSDFPRINDDLAGLPTRYGYLAESARWGDDEITFDGIVKHDLAAGTATRYRYGPGQLSGEAAFAPDPSRDDEDAGWLLNFVHDTGTATSALVIVDAQALEEVARVELPRRVPAGFHGQWLPDPVARPTSTV